MTNVTCYLDRLHRWIYIPLLDDNSRVAILQAVLTQLPGADDGALSLLANKTKDFSGAVLTKICQCAYKLAIRETIKAKKNVLDKQQWILMNQLLYLKFVVIILKNVMSEDVQDT